MKLEFDIIKPNLYMVGDEIYFSIGSSDIINASRCIDETIKEHIGELKVTETDIETIKKGRVKVESRVKYTVPLRRYLNVLEEDGVRGAISTDSAKLFNLGYLIDAQTIEDSEDMNNWRMLQHNLTNPNKAFEEYDKNHFVCRVDREKTLREMEKLYKELNPKIPENYSQLLIMSGEIPQYNHKTKLQYVGQIAFVQLKAKDKTKIEAAKTCLADKLKEFDGLCLSFDVPGIHNRMIDLYNNAPELIQKYGDILKSDWKKRLFKLDP